MFRKTEILIVSVTVWHPIWKPGQRQRMGRRAIYAARAIALQRVQRCRVQNLGNILTSLIVYSYWRHAKLRIEGHVSWNWWYLIALVVASVISTLVARRLLWNFCIIVAALCASKVRSILWPRLLLCRVYWRLHIETVARVLVGTTGFPLATRPANITWPVKPVGFVVFSPHSHQDSRRRFLSLARSAHYVGLHKTQKPCPT